MEVQDAYQPPEKTPAVEVGSASERVVVHVEAELGEFITEYLEHRRQDAQAIPAELAAGDYPAVWQRGHNMKGIGSPFGFDFITDVGAALEQAAQRRDVTATRRCVAVLADYLARLEVRLVEGGGPDGVLASATIRPTCSLR